jgi:integrase
VARHVEGPWYRESKGTWYATIGGKKTSLGVRGAGNRKAAEEAWHDLCANGKPKVDDTPEPMTVAEVVAGFLADADGRVKPKTLRWYRDFLEPFSQRHGAAKADDLTPTLVESYARKPNWSSSTRHDFLGALAGVFRWAERGRLITRSPLLGLRRPPKTSRGSSSLLTADEHARLLEVATPQFRLFLTVLYATGARPGEVAAITAENLDADAGLVRLAEHKTAHKGKVRVLYLSPDTVALLKRQKMRHPVGALLRNRTGKPWTGWAVVKAMESARSRAGLNGKTAYGLRHTFATDALANGVPDAQVAELLGHSGTAMLHKHYAHLGARATALRAALGKVR